MSGEPVLKRRTVYNKGGTASNDSYPSLAVRNGCMGRFFCGYRSVACQQYCKRNMTREKEQRNYDYHIKRRVKKRIRSRSVCP